VALTIALWLGPEGVGALIGSMLGLGIYSYVLALLLAAAGGVASYWIAKNCTPGDDLPEAEVGGGRPKLRAHGTGGRSFQTRPGRLGGIAVPCRMAAAPLLSGAAEAARREFYPQWRPDGGFLLFLLEACYFLTTAALAAAVYLVFRKGWWNWLIAGLLGLASAFLAACNEYADALYQRTMGLSASGTSCAL
jgi:hypothetical protein